MTVARRMAIGYGVLVLLALVLAGIGGSSIYSLRADYSDHFEEAVAKTEVAGVIAQNATALSGDVLAFIVDVDHREEHRARLDQDAALLQEALTEVEALEQGTGHGEHAGEVDALRQLATEFQQKTSEILALVSTAPEVASVRAAEELVPIGQQLREAAEEYCDDENALAATAIEGVNNRATALWITQVVVGVLAMVAAVAASLLLARSINSQLRSAVASLGSSTAEILAMVTQVAAGAAETAASTNEANVTVEEVKQTAVLAHEKASSAARGAGGAVEVIGSAQALVEETVTGIERMQSEMDVLFATINSLSERTQAAGDIIASVNDLAEQSNLLSVNASIEAAKAGEHGKGFAVVAQEVKSLAEQSKQAVAQVRTMLGEIQKASQTAVQAAASGRESVEVGRQKSMEAGEVMQRVAEGAADDSQASLQVVASSQQQLAGMEQIAQAIASINGATAQAVSGTRQVEQEVKQLQDLATSLKGLVEAKTASEAGPR